MSVDRGLPLSCCSGVVGLCAVTLLLAFLGLCRDVRFNQQINLVQISVLWLASVVLIVVLWPMQFDTCDAVFG